MFTLLVVGVVLALLGVIVAAIAILGAVIGLVGTAAGMLSTAIFIAFCIYLVCRVGQSIYDDWRDRH